MKRALRHPKRRGEWVELQFMARAAAHGLTVSKPWGDCARYDFVVEWEGRFHRVQVKSTTVRRPEGGFHCGTITKAPYHSKQVYDRAQIDFFAFFIVPEDLWYIVPVREFGDGRSAAILNPFLPRNRYFRFLEAWHLLKRGERQPRKVRRSGTVRIKR